LCVRSDVAAGRRRPQRFPLGLSENLGATAARRPTPREGGLGGERGQGGLFGVVVIDIVFVTKLVWREFADGVGGPLDRPLQVVERRQGRPAWRR